MEDEPQIEDSPKKKPEKRKKKLSEILIIRQGGVFNKGLIMMFFVAYSCLTVIYRSAFGKYGALYMQIIDTIVEFVFLVDLILNFMTTYKDSEQNEVTDHKLIAQQYIFHGTFLFDFLPIVPLQFILEDELWLLVKMLRIFRLMSVAKLFDIQNQQLKSFIKRLFSGGSREK